jgi:hypothetical protein
VTEHRETRSSLFSAWGEIALEPVAAEIGPVRFDQPSKRAEQASVQLADAHRIG